jgi:hypothetical protein
MEKKDSPRQIQPLDSTVDLSAELRKMGSQAKTGGTEAPEENAYYTTDSGGRPFETDENGLPLAPGTDGRDESHPFDPENLEKIRGDYVDVSPQTMVCVAGRGCAHYEECGDALPTDDHQTWAVPHRICTKFHEGNSGDGKDDAGGEGDITDQEMYYCTAFRPRHWWDLRAQLRRIGNFVDVWTARDRLGYGFSWYPEVIMARLLEPAAIELGLKADLRKEED